MKVRLIPMNHDKEFKDRSIEAIQNNFFMGDEMPLSRGTGSCRCFNDTYGLQDVDDGDLLLFQMDSMIIASANLFDKPIKSNEPGYKAEYLLRKDSIKVFKPITYDELKEHCKDFNRFGQGKTELTSLGLDLDWLSERIGE